MVNLEKYPLIVQEEAKAFIHAKQIMAVKGNQHPDCLTAGQEWFRLANIVKEIGLEEDAINLTADLVINMKINN